MNSCKELSYLNISGRAPYRFNSTIENINGIMSFVGPKGKEPIPLRSAEIKRIFGEVERKDGREVMVTPFKKGDFVKVIAGPFIDFSGTVEEVNDDKQKVKIVISIFGRLILLSNGIIVIDNDMLSSGFNAPSL